MSPTTRIFRLENLPGPTGWICRLFPIRFGQLMFFSLPPGFPEPFMETIPCNMTRHNGTVTSRYFPGSRCGASGDWPRFCVAARTIPVLLHEFSMGRNVKDLKFQVDVQYVYILVCKVMNGLFMWLYTEPRIMTFCDIIEPCGSIKIGEFNWALLSSLLSLDNRLTQVDVNCPLESGSAHQRLFFLRYRPKVDC